MESIVAALILIILIGFILFLVANSIETRLSFEEKTERERFTHRKVPSFTEEVIGIFDSNIWKLRNRFSPTKKRAEIHYRELMKALLGLNDSSLHKLLSLYKEQFGKGAARYAQQTYRKWEMGNVRPQRQTFERFLVHLPKVMSFDLKCEVLRRFIETFGTKDHYDLTVFTDDWEQTLEPLVKKIIDKPYLSTLPKEIEDRLLWLADDEMKVAKSILKQSQVEEGKIAVSMLREEFSNIEKLLANTKGRRRVRHKLKFPYGTINLEIKRR